MNVRNEKILSWLILSVLVIVWGSSFILIKRGLEVFSAQQVGALRVGITFLFFIPFVFSRFNRIKKHHWLPLTISAIVGNGAPAFLFAKAQTVLDSSLAGILNSLTPLFTLLVGVILFQLKTKWINVSGVFIGLVGAAGLIYASSGGNFEFNLGYSMYIIIAALGYGVNVNIIKNKLSDLDTISITAFGFFIIGGPIVIYLLAATDIISKFTLDTHEVLEGVAYLSILAVVGTALALIIFNKLIKMTSAVFASSVTYLIPIIALMWGIIDGEVFKIAYLLWIAMILIGVFLVNKKHNAGKKSSLEEKKMK